VGSGTRRLASGLCDRALSLRLSSQAVVMTITPRASGVIDNYPAGQLGLPHFPSAHLNMPEAGSQSQ